jgi:hypothetical protein
VLSGFAADQTSLAAPALIAAGCALVAGILSLFLIETAPARTRGRAGQREPEIQEAA